MPKKQHSAKYDMMVTTASINLTGVITQGAG